MSAESMSSLSSLTCIKVNFDKVNILQLLNCSNPRTRADWDFLPLLSLLSLHYTKHNANKCMKWDSSYGITRSKDEFFSVKDVY